VIQRVFRIWVPFALVIALAAGLCREVGGPLPQLTWLNTMWNQPLSWQLLAGHLLMLGTSAYVTLDSPMWSLVHEMRISLIFPLLTRVAALSLPRLVGGAALLFTLLSISHVTGPLMAAAPGPLPRELLHSLLDTVRYGLFFVLGIALAVKGSAIHAWLQQRPALLRTALWVLAFALLAVPFLTGYLELAYALGAALLLALCTASVSARRLLGAPWLTWLGKVSYSLYLVHMLVLLTLVHVLRPLLPLQAILPLAVVSSLVCAELCNRFIELPANRLGKRLAAQTQPHLP
jgi:peptidoglycan/LPS O-acetylase OafA/YrhL